MCIADMSNRDYKMNPEKREQLPKIAFVSFASRFQAPKLTEGFEEILVVDFMVSISTTESPFTQSY